MTHLIILNKNSSIHSSSSSAKRLYTQLSDLGFLCKNQYLKASRKVAKKTKKHLKRLKSFASLRLCENNFFLNNFNFHRLSQ